MADKHKIHNWSEYNTNLVNRGNIYFVFEQERDVLIKYCIKEGFGNTCDDIGIQFTNHDHHKHAFTHIFEHVCRENHNRA